MITIKLKDFANTGEFGPVQMQMSKTTVVSLLGTPSYKGDFTTDLSGINYGWYEFAFFEDKLFSIQNDSYSWYDQKAVKYRNKNFSIDPWFMKSSIPIRVTDVVKALEIDKIVYKTLVKDRNILIMLPSGFYFDFENYSENQDDKMLIGFRFSKHHLK